MLHVSILNRAYRLTLAMNEDPEPQPGEQCYILRRRVQESLPAAQRSVSSQFPACRLLEVLALNDTQRGKEIDRLDDDCCITGDPALGMGQVYSHRNQGLTA